MFYITFCEIIPHLFAPLFCITTCDVPPLLLLHSLLYLSHTYSLFSSAPSPYQNVLLSLACNSGNIPSNSKKRRVTFSRLEKDLGYSVKISTGQDVQRPHDAPCNNSSSPSEPPISIALPASLVQLAICHHITSPTTSLKTV